VALTRASAQRLGQAIDTTFGAVSTRNLPGVNGKTKTAFLEESALLLLRSRRLLMWTYAYAFYGYLPKSAQSDRTILEDQQGRLEAFTNQIHSELVGFCEGCGSQDCAAETAKILDGDPGLLSGWKFKEAMTLRSEAVTKFIEGISVQIKNWEDAFVAECDVGGKRVLRRQASDTGGEDVAGGFWTCEACTFANHHASHTTACEMCRTPRGGGGGRDGGARGGGARGGGGRGGGGR